MKAKIKELDRTQDDNLYGRHKRARKTVRERDADLSSLLHEDLQNNPRVSIKKWERR